MTSPTCAVHVVFNIKPEFREQFHEVILKQAKNSLTREDWCHQFDVAVDPEKPNSFMLYETYDDRDAFAKHRETDHFAEFNSSINGWVESKEVAVWDILDNV
jgi:quinol monooxygenase YgiN